MHKIPYHRVPGKPGTSAAPGLEFERGRSIKAHRIAIRSHLGFHEGTVADATAMVDWLCTEILPHESKAHSLVENIYRHYRTPKIVSPTAGRIDRLVPSTQRQYSEQICQEIAAFSSVL